MTSWLLGMSTAALVGVCVYLWQRLAIMRVATAAEEKRIRDMEAHYTTLLGTMKNEFKALSEEVLKEKRAQLEQEGLAGMTHATQPLIQEIQAFRKRVDEVNTADVERTTALKTNIATLVEQTHVVSDQADKLATALRAEAQVTGQWGEIQLKRVLELGGLQENVDYTYQETFTAPGADHANLRTDILIKMPEDRWLVIDAKTTFAAYVDYVGANAEAKGEALKRIIQSLTEHIKEMKTASYHKHLAQVTDKRIFNTMFMYIPFEEVYLVAMKAEVDVNSKKVPLREWAWQNDVVLMNASGLLPIARLLSKFWADDRATKKVLAIKKAAEALIDKFNLFLQGSSKKDGFLVLGTSLAAAVTAYNESLKRLSEGKGSILKRLTDLKEMGIQSVQTLPSAEQLESRQVTASVEQHAEVSAES